MLKLPYPAHLEESEVVFDPETVAELEPGWSIIVATTGADGAPVASRGWGLTVVTAGTEFRLLLDADDAPTLANLAEGGAIAVTTANVYTLRSMQLKGRAVAIEPADDADRACARRHSDDLMRAIEETDGAPTTLTERLVPAAFVACRVAVETQYDQTPGPTAGVPLHDAAP